MTLNPTRWNLSHICVTSVQKSKFHSVSLYDQPFLRYRQFEKKEATEAGKSTEAYYESLEFWNKSTEWPQKDLESYYGKCNPYICY